MQAIPRVAPPPPLAVPVGTRSASSGAEGFSRILDETLADAPPAPDTDGAAGRVDTTPADPEQEPQTGPEVPAASRDHAPMPDEMAGLALPVLPHLPPALPASADAALPATPPVFGGPDPTAIAATPSQAGVATPALPQPPRMAPQTTTADPNALPDVAPPRQMPAAAGASAAGTLDKRADPSSLSALPSTGPNGLDASVLVAPAAPEARRIPRQDTAALAFALRTGPDAAEGAPAEPEPLTAAAALRGAVTDAAPARVSRLPVPEANPPSDPRDDGTALLAPAAAPPTDRPHSASPSTPSATAHALPATLGHDLATILHRRPEGPVEVSLSPDELGKLRVSLWQDGAGLRVVVQAERPETLDLLRRNSETLLQEIRASGFSGGSMSFAHWGGSPGGSAPPAAPPPETRAQMEPPAPLPPPRSAASQSTSSNLDLRY